MKRLLLGILCAVLLVPLCSLSVCGEEWPTLETMNGVVWDTAIPFDYVVCFEAGKSPDQLPIPKWVQAPCYRLVSHAREGAIYYLEFQVQGSASGQVDAWVRQTFTPQQGVVDYQACYEIARRAHKGDVNLDGVTDARDALLCLQMAVGQYVPVTLEEYCGALVSDDMARDLPVKPNALCALRILRMAVTQ